MVYRELRKAVAGYARREESSFLVSNGTLDLLGLCINQARKYAEKKADFEFSKAKAKLGDVPFVTGALFADITDLEDNPISVRGIQQAWNADGAFNKIRSMEVMSSQAYQFRLQRRDMMTTVDAVNFNQQPYNTSPFPPTLVLHGTKLYVYPEDATLYAATTVNLRLDVLTWLPDYELIPDDEDDTQTDFIMEFGSDWLIYNSLIRLNFFLKEDQRVQIEAAVMKDAFESLKQWNDSLVIARSQEYNLD